MKLSRERAQNVWEEMLPLFRLHYKEVAHFTDIPLDPDFEMYFKMEAAGSLRVYTAREDDGKLIGYAVYFIKHNIHYKSSLQALQDVIFVDPNKRGVGAKLILWCDKQLKDEGVQIVFQHIKVATPHTIALFERLGYEKIDMILGKRLDVEG